MTREQFIALVSEEQESLRRFLLALCEGDRMEAEDIAQEAMVKAYIAMDRFVERAKFATWLCRAARVPTTPSNTRSCTRLSARCR